jgi:hypothetical protein
VLSLPKHLRGDAAPQRGIYLGSFALQAGLRDRRIEAILTGLQPYDVRRPLPPPRPLRNDLARPAPACGRVAAVRPGRPPGCLGNPACPDHGRPLQGQGAGPERRWPACRPGRLGYGASPHGGVLPRSVPCGIGHPAPSAPAVPMPARPARPLRRRGARAGAGPAARREPSATLP